MSDEATRLFQGSVIEYDEFGRKSGRAITMSIAEIEPLTVKVPLHEDPPGVLRVGSSRVLLEIVLRAFRAGVTAEAIVQSYDTLNLADVYAVFSYYIAHPQAMNDYLRSRDEAAERTRAKIEESQSSQQHLRDLIMTRARAKGLIRDQAGH